MFFNVAFGISSNDLDKLVNIDDFIVLNPLLNLRQWLLQKPVEINKVIVGACGRVTNHICDGRKFSDGKIFNVFTKCFL